VFICFDLQTKLKTVNQLKRRGLPDGYDDSGEMEMDKIVKK